LKHSRITRLPQVRHAVRVHKAPVRYGGLRLLLQSAGIHLLAEGQATYVSGSVTGVKYWASVIIAVSVAPVKGIRA
jgi:hypothetical protein